MGSMSYLFFSICLIVSFFNIITKLTEYCENETLKSSIILINSLICSLGMFYVLIKVIFMQLKNEEKIKIFSYKYCEIFWE